jgi:hypothetical protein
MRCLVRLLALMYYEARARFVAVSSSLIHAAMGYVPSLKICDPALYDADRRMLTTKHPPIPRYLVANESHYYIDIARMLKESFPGAPVPTEKVPGSALKPEFDLTRATKDLGHKPSRTVAASLALQGQSFVNAGLLSDSILKQ